MILDLLKPQDLCFNCFVEFINFRLIVDQAIDLTMQIEPWWVGVV